jgi:ssDNA-binding Zn-finger/Zn-ribbon topoisomerase 1
MITPVEIEILTASLEKNRKWEDGIDRDRVRYSAHDYLAKWMAGEDVEPNTGTNNLDIFIAHLDLLALLERRPRVINPLLEVERPLPPVEMVETVPQRATPFPPIEGLLTFRYEHGRIKAGLRWCEGCSDWFTRETWTIYHVDHSAEIEPVADHSTEEDLDVHWIDDEHCLVCTGQVPPIGEVYAGSQEKKHVTCPDCLAPKSIIHKVNRLGRYGQVRCRNNTWLSNIDRRNEGGSTKWSEVTCPKCTSIVEKSRAKAEETVEYKIHALKDDSLEPGTLADVVCDTKGVRRTSNKIEDVTCLKCKAMLHAD